MLFLRCLWPKRNFYEELISFKGENELKARNSVWYLLHITLQYSDIGHQTKYWFLHSIAQILIAVYTLKKNSHKINKTSTS